MGLVQGFSTFFMLHATFLIPPPR